jgi:hypothetical protein
LSHSHTGNNGHGHGPDDHPTQPRVARGDVVAAVYAALQRGEPVAGPGHPTHTSVRAFKYKGHACEVKTTYTLTVDGRDVHPHISVADDGHVSCHALPAYRFLSAVDLLKQLIDAFPKDFKKARKR